MKEEIKLKNLILIFLYINELSSMNDSKFIVEMFTKFIDIISGLKSFGKAYKEWEKVIKI